MTKSKYCLFTLFISLLLVLLFSACGATEENPIKTPSATTPESTTVAPSKAPDTTPAEALTAEQIVNYFAQEGMPIGNLVVYTEATDVNNMLGRPGGYISKVNFEDERTLNEYIDTTASNYSPNNTLEVFISEVDAKARYDYIDSVTAGTILAQYMYLEGTMLLRLERSLLPSDAEIYETLLKSVTDNSFVVSAAPNVTRKINNTDTSEVISDTAQDLPSIDAPSATDNDSAYNWREFLKDYEEFVTAYVVVLKKVNDNPTDLSILSDYMNMMTKSIEFTSKYEDISSSLDNSNDLSEFLKEWTRIYAILLEALTE